MRPFLKSPAVLPNANTVFLASLEISSVNADPIPPLTPIITVIKDIHEKKDVNYKNPDCDGGKLAISFAQFLKQLKSDNLK